MSIGRSLATTVHFWGPLVEGLYSDCLSALAELRLPLTRLHHGSGSAQYELTALLLGVADEPTQRNLEAWAQSRGLQVSIAGGPGLPPHERICVTIIGDLSNPKVLFRVTKLLEECQLNISETRSIGGTSFRGLEFFAEDPRRTRVEETTLTQLRTKILAESSSLGVDVAVQRDDFYRRNRRMLCMDVDSTFVKGEFIDELAELCGVKAQVATITARAMRGELDFPGALQERVQLLAGLPMERALELCDRFELTPGADDLVCTVKKMGMKIGLVSGGFDFFVHRLKRRFGLDFAFANELEVKDGVLTGRLLGSIVDGQRKSQILRDMAHIFGIDLEQTIAAGDGANDVFMLKTAGLGIAYQAKPKLQEVADACFNHHDRLDTLLYLMGFDAPEVTFACRRDQP